MADTKTDKNGKSGKKTAVDNEIIFVVFLMLLIVVIPIAISVLDIGAPIPGYSQS